MIHIQGRLFPYRIGGMAMIDVFESQRRAGAANLLMRGDGKNLGWYVCEKLVRTHHYISFEGVGQQIDFQAALARVPVPNGISNLQTLFMAGGLPATPT